MAALNNPPLLFKEFPMHYCHTPENGPWITALWATKERRLETESPTNLVQQTVLDILQHGREVEDPRELSEEERLGRGETYYRLGKIYYDKSDLQFAKVHFERALELCYDVRDFYFEFKVLGFLVRIASELLDSQASEFYIERSSAIVERAMNELGNLDAEVFYNAGIVNTYHGQFEQSFQNFHLAVSKAQSENELEIIAKSYYALATGNYKIKNFELALNYLSQLSKLLKVLKKKYLEGTMDLLYGNIYSDLGDCETASRYYKQANSLLADKACWNLYGYILLGRGVLAKRMGKFNRSLWYFQVAEESVASLQFRRLRKLIQAEVNNVNDSSVDIYLDRKNRMAQEKVLGTIDFKHRFVLLEILFLLAKKPGIYYDKNQLTGFIWGDEYNPLIHDKLIYTSISRLRKLIEPREEKRKYIIRGKDGYAFNPHVNVRLSEEPEEGGDSLGNIDISSPV